MEARSDELTELLATDLSQHFAMLVQSYGAQLHACAHRWVGNSYDAEDIVQTTFERAFLTLSTYPQGRIRVLKLRPWLYKVLLNVAHNYVSRSKEHTVAFSAIDDPTLLEQEDDWREQPEMRSEMEALVATLAPCYRDALSLCYFHDLSYQETATALNKSVGTIKFYVHRGVKQLREQLNRQMDEVP